MKKWEIFNISNGDVFYNFQRKRYMFRIFREENIQNFYFECTCDQLNKAAFKRLQIKRDY